MVPHLDRAQKFLLTREKSKYDLKGSIFTFSSMMLSLHIVPFESLNCPSNHKLVCRIGGVTVQTSNNTFMNTKWNMQLFHIKSKANHLIIIHHISLNNHIRVTLKQQLTQSSPSGAEAGSGGGGGRTARPPPPPPPKRRSKEV